MTVIEKENNDIGQNILYELYLFSEWKLEREFLQKADNIFPNGISLLRQWIKIFEPERTLIDCVTQCLLKQLNWQIALGDEGKVIAVLGDNILEIRTKRGDYSTVVARTAVVRDAYPQWRKMIWSPDCTFLAVANSNGSVGFYDLTATNLFTIPPDCSQPAGIICSDTTHALSGIVFVPCRVKNNKWASEVLLVDYKGKLRSYLISQTDGSKLIHTFNFDGGVSALTYDVTTSLLFVAGNPRLLSKNVQSAADVGITAWRVINDAPFYKLSVASDQTFNNSTDSIRYIIPFGRPTISSFVFKMAVSQDGNKLVCIHTNGDISLWRMPLLKLISLWDLSRQPAFDLSNPLTKKKPIKGNVNKQFVSEYAPADVNWWNDNAIILARYNGSVTVCDIENLQNLLEKGPQFFQGTPQVTLRFNKTFIALECETKTMSAKQLQENGDAQETSQALIEKNIDDSEEEPSYIETGTELFKSILYLITDMERFQPKPKKIRLVTRIYRLLGVKSITPDQLYARKIQNGNYTEALKLAESYSLDSDLVYQQQWRTTPVSHESIKNYLAKMKKKTWVVHQCVDRLPESLHAAKELLQFGLKVTKDEVLKDLDANISEDSLENLTIESLSSMASEMVRCRHLMLFYIKRLQLYEAIIKVEKSTYSREEYHRLRSNSIVRSAIEYAHEGRTCALFCLWPHLNLKMKLTVLDNLPETINPIDYKQLLPTCNDTLHDSQKEIGNDNSLDWCEKEVFRSLWSNLAEEISPETTTHASLSASEMIKNWYCLRARKIEEQSGLVSYALLLLELGQDGKVQGLEILHHLLLTLTTLIYEVQNLDVTLQELENCSCLETCQFLMINGDVETFVDDLKKLVLPYLERYSAIYGETDILQSLKEYLTELSKTDLKLPLLVLKSAADFKINVLNHLCMVEKFLFANTKTDQLPLYYAVMDTVPTESDSSITPSALLLRLSELERLLSASDMLSEHGAPLTLVELTELRSNPTAVRMHLIKMTRNTATSRIKPPKEDWDLLLKDILELHSTIFCCVDLELCYEVYVSALLTSGDLASISLASAVLTCSDSSTVLAPVSGNGNVPHRLSYQRSLALVLNSSKEYFNSASSLIDPALELSRACLMLIQQDDTAIATELDLIASLHLLYEFDLSILPIQVRLQEDRMRLIHICLESTQHAYQEVNKLLQLAELLRVAADDSTTREALVLVAVAERALEDAPTGAVAAGAAAHRLTQGGSALGWQVAHRVATELRYGDLTSRMDLLAYSALHCTPDKIESILKARINLEAEGLQRDMTQLLSTNEVFRPPSIHDSIESNEEDYADAMTSPSVENKGLFIPIQMIDKQIKSFGNLLTDRSWQDKIKLSWFNRTPVKATDASDKPENDNLATCEEWYRSIYPEYRISQYGYCYDSFSVPDPGTVVDVTLYQTLLRYQALREHLDYNNSNTDLCKVLMQSGLAKLQYDTGLAVSHLLGAYQKQPSIPHMPHALADNQLHVMLYSLLLRNYGNDMGDQVFFTKPLELASMWTKEKSEDKEEELTRTITSCLQQLVNRVESARLREMGCNVDVSLFACNSIYQREVIFELSRNTSEEAFTLALQLARKYGIPELNVQLQHACHLLLEHNKLDHATVVASLNDPETLRSFKNNSVDVVNCLKKQVWNELLGTDHAGLLLYFGLLHNVNDQYLHGHFSANDHIKLLKKTKAASNNLDYKLLLDYTCVEELEDHILSIMKPENVAIVVKLLRSLPVIIRPQLSPSTLYSHWLVIHFFDTKANLEQEWLQQYKECSSYFNKLSCNDLMEFMKEICFNHKAIVRVPAKSRLNMMKNALNYCQLQKEKETLSTDSMRDNSWQQAEGSLTSWINFTRSFHDSRVSKIIQAAAEVPEDVWQELQMSRGEEDMMNPIAYLMLRTDLKFDTINNLVINLSEEIPILSILFYAIDNCEDNVMYAYKIGTHICDWASKEEHIDRSDELIERIKPLLPSLPAVMRLQLLTLFQAGHQNIEDNLPILTQYSCETIRSAWNDKEVPDISDDSFVFEESRKAIFDQLIVTADTWQKKKVLVDLLTYWPPFISVNGHSPCCMLLKCLLDTPSEITDNVPLLKLLLKNQSVSENEALWIADQSPKDSLEGKAWLLLLNGSEACINHVPTLFNDVAPTFDCQHLHEDLLLALLKHDLLLPLVGSSVYPVILQFIMKLEVEGSDSYNLSWLIEKLPKEKYLAEVGQLRLNKLGVPAALKGFSQSILIHKKNM